MKRVCAAILWMSACGNDADPVRTSPLWSDGEHLRDSDGRVAILRGINARVDGVFDVTFSDGRTATVPIQWRCPGLVRWAGSA